MHFGQEFGNVTSGGSDVLDLQAKWLADHDLANIQPFRLFTIASQQFIDGTWTTPLIWMELLLWKKTK